MADNVRVILPSLAKLEKAACDAIDACELYHLKVEIRDELIVEAINAGFSQREVAAAAQVKPPRIITITGQFANRTQGYQ